MRIKSLLTLIWSICLFPFYASAQSKHLPHLDALAHPIDAAELEADLADLEKIGPLLEGVTILGLGEATHGSRDFFTLKARIIRYGIEELGYKVVAFEAPFGQEGINRYVQGEPVKLEKVMPELAYWPWQTEEVRELLIWLRTYNQGKSPADRVHFVGIDTQSLAGAKKWQGWLQVGNASEEIPLAVDRMDALAGMKTWKLQSMSLAWLDSSMMAMNQIEDWAKDQDWSSLDTAQSLIWAQHHLEMLRQVITYRIRKKKEVPGYWNDRDSCMAANVKWVQTQGYPGEKILLWAHNGHISSWEGQTRQGPARRMGYYLDQAFQDAYYALGFDFGAGNLVARGPNGTINEWSVKPAHRKSLAYQLASVSHDMCWLDGQELASNSALSKWLQKFWWMRQIGAGFDPEAKTPYYYTKFAPPFSHFDGILFVKNVHAAHPITRPKIGRIIPVEGFPGQEIKIEARMRFLAEADTSCQPRMLLHCWTQYSTLAMHMAVPEQDIPGKNWTLRLEGTIPAATTILKCELLTTSDQEFSFSDFKVYRQSGEDWLEISDLTSGTDAWEVPYGITASPREEMGMAPPLPIVVRRIGETRD